MKLRYQAADRVWRQSTSMQAVIPVPDDAVVKTVNTPGVREKLVGFGADPLTMTPDEFTRFVRADIEMWGRVVKAVGVKVD